MHFKKMKGKPTIDDTTKLVEMVIYKTYYNGTLCVNNVPYTVKVDMDNNKKERVKEEFISSDTYEQLATIFYYMEKNKLKKLDYQKFMTVNNYSGKELNRSANEICSISMEDREAVIDYVMKVWIEKYYEMHLRAYTNAFMDSKESEEKSINKAKLEFFHSRLEVLPALHQEIIRKKYLQLESNGRFPIDDFIYSELHIGRSNYYKQKKEALYWLGLSLMNQ